VRERIIYECEHCNRYRRMNKTKVKEHESLCWYNTKNKTCVTCEYSLVFEKGNKRLRHCQCLSKTFKDMKPIEHCTQYKEIEE